MLLPHSTSVHSLSSTVQPVYVSDSIYVHHLSQRSLVTFVTLLMCYAKTADQRTMAAVQQLAQMWPDVFSGVVKNGSTNGAAANGDALNKVS